MLSLQRLLVACGSAMSANAAQLRSFESAHQGSTNVCAVLLHIQALALVAAILLAHLPCCVEDGTAVPSTQSATPYTGLSDAESQGWQQAACGLAAELPAVLDACADSVELTAPAAVSAAQQALIGCAVVRSI